MRRQAALVAFVLTLVPMSGLRAQKPADGPGPPYKSAKALLEANDRRLIRELTDYIAVNPKAGDLDKAYTTLFERVIEHDWFLDHEKAARAYLDDHAEGAVRPYAQIIVTMARAQDGKFEDAAIEFKELMKVIDRDDQEEFASEFADSLASAATVAGEYKVAKDVYGALLDRFGGDDKLKRKVDDDLARLDMVGKPAPNLNVRDRAGVAFRLSDYKGKYVLVDFWATWCEPCIEDLPTLQAAYKAYGPKRFEIVSVSMDETTTPLNDYLKTHDMPWRQIHNETCGADVVAAFGVNSIPASFLVDPNGVVVRLELRGPALTKTLATLMK
jgi:thiol-disulfide isomerase/thioredoxin